MKSLLQYLIESKGKPKKPKEVLSFLDNILNGKETESLDGYFESNGPRIYAFVTDKVKDAVKIGFTDQHPKKRIEQWADIYGRKEGEVTLLGHWSAEEFDDAGQRVFFYDHAVHKEVVSRGYDNVKAKEGKFDIEDLTDKGKEVLDLHYSKEFFRKYKKVIEGDTETAVELSEQLLADILKEMKKSIKEGKFKHKLYKYKTKDAADKNWGTPKSYRPTDLQKECIENGVKAIEGEKKNLLMAAVMRFGKTYASYDIVKGAGLKKVVVVSGKADVRKAWRDNINHQRFYKDFVFIEPGFTVEGKSDKYKSCITWTRPGDSRLTTEQVNSVDIQKYVDNGKTVIVFCSLQDLSGSIREMKDKHKGIFDMKYDMMIVDETHYGSHANAFGDITKLKDKNIADSDISDEQENERTEKEIKALDIKCDIRLQVSGTPYYILASSEMYATDACIISKVSYNDMMKARDEWEQNNKDKKKWQSPYFGIPTLHKIGLKLTKECREKIAEYGYDVKFDKLFEVRSGKFKNESAIRSLMKSLFGDDKGGQFAFLKNKSVEGSKVCNHTIIVLPRISSCEAMKKLLDDMHIGRDVKCIVNVNTFDKVKIGDLNDWLEENDEKGKKTVILTVNRFLTGVSMPLVDSMIYLKNAKSPQEYDQNIFRLCTRNTREVDDPDGDTPKYINKKENVYLIDFNIDNMFNMLVNSARMKANADNDVSIKHISDILEEELDTVNIFCEYGDDIGGKMKKIEKKDLMEIYTGYNKSSNISKIAESEAGMFSDLFRNAAFKKNMISDFTAKVMIGGGSKLTTAEQALQDQVDNTSDTEDTLDNLERPTGGSGEEAAVNQDASANADTSLATKSKNELIPPSKETDAELAKKKFIGVINSLLLYNICIDEPFTSLKDLLDDAKKDEVHEKMLIDFNIPVSALQRTYEIFAHENYVQNIDALLTRMSLLIENLEKNKDPMYFFDSISSLNKISDTEFATPQKVVSRMIDKLPRETYEKADSILLAYEKQAEFLIGLKEKFGKRIASKCKIIPSSKITEYIIKKMVKHLGTNNYIYNYKDIFEGPKMDKINEENILKENKGKKFDIILSNPPWGQSIHYEFTQKYLDLAHDVISIMPISIIKRNSKHFNKFKDVYNDRLYDVEEVDSSVFQSTNMQNCCIYCFKDKIDSLHIKYLDGKEENVNCINDKDYSGFTDYEKEIVKYLYNEKPNWVNGDFVKVGMPRKENIPYYTERILSKLPDDKVYMIVNATDGTNKVQPHFFFSSKVGQICDTKEELKKLLYERGGAVAHYMYFDNYKSAENCKNAMQRPLLRFPLSRTQSDQNLTAKHFNYIPDIDWSNDQTKTDEGILKLCGCPSDQCIKYVNYCNNVIKEADRKKP